MKKKIFVSLIIIVLLSIIGGEIYYYVNHNENIQKKLNKKYTIF